MFKKIFLAAFLVIAFSVCAFAGEGSDTVGKDKLLPQLRYGYAVSSWETNDIPPFTNWDSTAHSYYAQVNWGILDNVDLIALVGGRSLRMESELDTYFPFGSASFTFRQDLVTDYVPMFMWGLGAKGTFYRADNGFYVGAGALFTHSFSQKYSMTDYITLDWDDPATADIYAELEFDNMLRTNFYQVTADVHAGWNFRNIGLTPYIGVDYTWARMLTGIDEADDVVYKLERPWTMYAGFDYFLNDRLYVNVEGRMDFADAWGVETGIGYMFDICKKPAPVPEPALAPVIEPKLEPMSSK